MPATDVSYILSNVTDQRLYYPTPSLLRLVFMNFSPPSQLPTPPETDNEVLAGGQYAIDFMNPSGLHIADPEMTPHPSAIRRVSTLAYHSSPLRDPREKPNGRQSRWLIVVIPPSSLVEDHGPLGHTLTSGPTQRLSQGIVMPLQTTVRRHVSYTYYGLLNNVCLDVWPTFRHRP